MALPIWDHRDDGRHLQSDCNEQEVLFPQLRALVLTTTSDFNLPTQYKKKQLVHWQKKGGRLWIKLCQISLMLRMHRKHAPWGPLLVWFSSIAHAHKLAVCWLGLKRVTRSLHKDVNWAGERGLLPRGHATDRVLFWPPKHVQQEQHPLLGVEPKAGCQRCSCAKPHRPHLLKILWE